MRIKQIGVTILFPTLSISAAELSDLYRDALSDERTAQSMYQDMSLEYPESGIYQRLIRAEWNHELVYQHIA